MHPGTLGLDGRTVIVTGASSGIGEATARVLVSAGANVALVARSVDKLERLADELGAGKRPARARAFPSDASDPDAVRESAEAIEAWAGGNGGGGEGDGEGDGEGGGEGGGEGVYGLANVAGYPMDERLWNAELTALTDEDFERVRAVDLDGARRWTQAVLPGMIDRGAGAIVYVSSTPALSGYKGTPYTEAKAALLGLMRDVARAHGTDGVRANAVALGNIGTEATLAGLDDEARAAAAAEASLKRWGEPAEVGRVMAWLLSPWSSYVTGQVVVVDGGALFR